VFTGLIETVQPVISSGATPAGRRICIELGQLACEGEIGQSISVNGACLTIARLEGTRGHFDIMAETLKVSTLSQLKPGSRVNLERAISLSDRLDGHIVQGHIDGIATIKSISDKGNFKDITFSANKELLSQMVTKGSVAIDGVSLTIAQMDAASFKVAVIPQTLRETILSSAKVGDKVNIETDIIGKMVKKHVENLMPSKNGFTEDKLKELGY